MSRIFGDKAREDVAQLIGELGSIEEASERVRLAALGLAAPLAEQRQGQLAREAARAAARYGAEDPEARSRAAAADAGKARFDAMRHELVRARVTPAAAEGEGAAMSGLVTRSGVPVAGATVSVLSEGTRQPDFTCTNKAGGFALQVPASVPLRLSVSLKDEGEQHRDKVATTLQPGQSRFRHVELDGESAPCPAPPPTPVDTTFPMVALVGQLEADARRLIAAQGLVLGERSEKDDPERAGRVIDQSPSAGTAVRAGDPVSVTVATDGRVEVPVLLGLSQEDAWLTLAKAELVGGKVGRREARPELEGRIVAQSPEAGARVGRRSAVDIEIGIARGGTQPTRPKPEIARIAELAAHRLEGGRPVGEGAPQEPSIDERLTGAGIKRLADLDKLLDGDRNDARDRLGLRTLAETDRLLAALRRARKELER